MADTKITSLQPPQAGYSVVPATDVLPIVVIADPGMATSGSTRKVTVNQLLGAGGTATLASATITGDLTVDTSTLKVDSTNNRVGIVNASPAYPLDVAGTAMRIRSASAYSALVVSSQDSQADTRNWAVATTFNNYGDLCFVQSNAQNGDPLTAGTTRMTLTTAGDVSVSTGNVVMATSGKGIDFSATASGSGTMTSELLNDYEEGTWTGTLKGSVSDPTTPVTATGRYTKIGRQVNVQIWFFGVNTTGASGEVSVAGLPFTNATGLTAVPGSASSSSLVTFTGTLVSQIGNGASIFELYSVNSNATATNATHNAGTSRSLALSSTYQVA